MPSTRDRLMEHALYLFAERGYWGVSLAQIGAACGITKQSLLHHYGSKDQLYRQLLEVIAEDLLTLVREVRSTHRDANAQMWHLLVLLDSGDAASHSRLRVIMRELLDIGERAETAKTWPLRGFLDSLVELIAAAPGWSETPKAHRLATAYLLLGALKYKLISTETLSGMYGQEAYNAFETAHRNQLRRAVDSALGQGAAAALGK